MGRRQPAPDLDAAVLAAVGQAIVVVDLDGRVARWNGAAEALYGWSEAQALGRPMVELAGVSTWGSMTPLQQQRIRHGDTVTDDYTIRRADGTRIPVRIVNRAVLDANGAMVAVVGVATNISELHDVRDHAQRRATQQAAVAALGRSALLDLDLDRLFDEAVQLAAEELDAPLAKVLEYEPADQTLWLRSGVGWKEGLVGHARIPAHADGQAAYTLHHGGAVRVSDLRDESRFSGPTLLTDHGVTSGVSTVIQTDDGPFGVLGVHTTTPQHFTEDDISFADAVAGVLASAVVRRRLEDELRTTIQRLEHSDAIRTGFLRATSHELRTPLTVVTGMASTLQRAWHDLDGPEVDDILDRMVAKGDHLQRLIEDLLDVDRLSAGLVTAVTEPRDLREVLETVLQRTDLGGRELQVSIDPVVVDVDAPKIERIVDNLLTNASRHTPPAACIRIEASTDDGWAVIAVTDDGPGIDLDDPTEIFEPFVQGRERATAPTPGTGLGLTLVRELTELHDGEVAVRTADEGGTRFEIRLPMARDAG